MRCPQCGERETRVVDSRDLDDRRRSAAAANAPPARCGSRPTSGSRPPGLIVVKRDGTRQEFDRERLASGLRKALTRRPVPDGAAEPAADAIEAELRAAGVTEVPSSRIGALAMEQLRASTRSPTSGSPASTRASRTSRTSSARSTPCSPSGNDAPRPQVRPRSREGASPVTRA